MRADVARLESDQDRLASRLTAIEVSGTTRSASTRPEPGPTVSPPSGERPALRVVVLKPGDETESSEATTTDEGAASQTVKAGREPDDDREPVAFGKKGSKARAKKTRAAGKEYDDAYALVRAKDYERAIPALTGFLVRFPDHANADAAMFWIGASHAAKGELPQAVEILEGVLARFPAGNKAPDALLELSRVYRKQGDDARAEQTMTRLRRDFPRSDAAQRAPKS